MCRVNRPNTRLLLTMYKSQIGLAKREPSTQDKPPIPSMSQASWRLFHASAVLHQDAVTFGGETRDQTGRFFCPRYDSSIFARTADETEVNLGSLDAPDQLMPTYESWVVNRESWLPPFPRTKRYECDTAGRLEETMMSGAVTRFPS